MRSRLPLLTLAARCALCLASLACGNSASPPVTVPTVPTVPPAATGNDWTRFGWDAARSNASTAPTGITALNVSSLVRQQVTIDGTVDGSPIYLHGVQVNGVKHDAFFVTTTYGKTLAIDASDGTILWRYTPSGYDSWAGSYQITTATPVADPGRAFVYAASPDGRIQKLAVLDGHSIWSTAITKLPAREKIAAALNFFNGRVIATTGGYVGDAGPYQGHVAILDAASGQLLSVWNTLCSDQSGLLDPASCPESDSAIWGRGGAVIDSTTGNIFVTTGNALWDGRTYWGDAVLELDPNGTHLIGNYTPANTSELNARDQDLGSASPALLGTVVAQGGKDGVIRLLDWTVLGGATPHLGGERQTVSTPSGRELVTAPAVWRSGTTTWLFAGDNGDTAAWTLSAGSLQPVWKSGHGGTSPVVAGGLLFVYDPSNGGLHVYQPDTGQELATLDCGGGHWNSPIVIDGRVALPEGSANDRRTTGLLNIWRVP